MQGGWGEVAVGVAVVVALVIGAACLKSRVQSEETPVLQHERFLSRLTYFRDERNGLCFAMLRPDGEGNASITLVPCEDMR